MEKQNSEITWEDVFLMCKVAGIKHGMDWATDTYQFLNPATQMVYQVSVECPEYAVRVLFGGDND